jgi:hypothetical protein
MPKMTKTCTITAEELSAAVAPFLAAAKVLVSVPRKEGGDLTASVEIGSSDFKAAIAYLLEVEVEALEELEITNKRDGSLVVSF